jgi:thiamine pyrophosphate-dependent acetolactate synthase large subunit-like protein
LRAERLPVGLTERPEPGWGSDAIAQLLSELDLPYLSLVPGASYRGLHDSLVNYLGNTKPQLVLCLHEEHAVAVAHGYAKATGRGMAVALHSNVGLMHATMAMFNAYCDRVPMLVLGATGPVDSARRRPWIDWIHTATDQAALVRNYCKWDDQPASVAAALESVMRAFVTTHAGPQAPAYVCLDAAMQETPLDATLALLAPARYPVPSAPAPAPEAMERTLAALRAARRPLLLMGRVGRSQPAWDARVALAERLGACVLTDLKTAAAFPTGHRLHPATPGVLVTDSGADLMRRSDLIISLEWTDIAGTLSAVFGEGPTTQVIVCSNDAPLHNGWSKDHFGLAASEVSIAADSDLLVDALLRGSAVGDVAAAQDWPGELETSVADQLHRGEDELLISELAGGLREALDGQSVCFTCLPSGWSGADVEIAGPLDYLGKDGGGGLGSGPGIAVGAALALDGTGRIPVAVLGDGDYLMGSSALWTAAHHRLPLLVVVANNRSFFNDEVHQARMARTRDRPVENRSVGLRLRDPDPDLAGLARSLGLAGYGPVRGTADLKAALSAAVGDVRRGGAAVVDVRVAPPGPA